MSLFRWAFRKKPRFGLDECAAYWQQVVDMNDHQKTAFTSILDHQGLDGMTAI